MLASALSAHRRFAALLIALIVLVLPGGSLVLAGLWLYRHYSAGRRTISASSALTPSPAPSTTSGFTSSSASFPSR